MKFLRSGREIRVFTISPRTADESAYWQGLCDTACWSEKYECTGVLIFTGNDTYIDPWIVAQFILANTKNISPLVAVNPVYMHPFSAAKMVSSLSHLYERKIFLNMVTGTALTHLVALGDTLDHDERYRRLLEYILIVRTLLGDPKPISFRGDFYKTTNLQLSRHMPPALYPEFVLAGQSTAARRVWEATGAIGIRMLGAKLEESVMENRGIHFGLLTRQTENEAWEIARQYFPIDQEGQEILELSMRNTDSVWKKKMKLEAGALPHNDTHSGYWLEPFRNFKADCPYIVGSHMQAASLLAALVVRGIDLFVLDIPAKEEEYENANEAFLLARQMAV